MDLLRGLVSRSNVVLPRIKKDAQCNSNHIPRPNKCHGKSETSSKLAGIGRHNVHVARECQYLWRIYSSIEINSNLKSVMSHAATLFIYL